MAESDESSSEPSGARDILISSSHHDMDVIIQQLKQPESDEYYNSAKTQYDFFVSKYPNLLAPKPLKMFISSSDRTKRTVLIDVLRETLATLRLGDFVFHEDALQDIKPLVIACLQLEESQESVERILFDVAKDLSMLDNDVWNEFEFYILRLVDTKPLRSFHLFISLPVQWRFIYRFMEKILEKAYSILVNLEQDVHDWSYVFRCVVKMGIMAIESEKRYDLVGKIVFNLVKTLENVAEEFLVKGFDDLVTFLLQDKIILNNSQCHFMLLVVSKFESNERLNVSLRKINHCVLQIHNPEVNVSLPPNERALELNNSWYIHLNSLSSLEVLKIFASNEFEDVSRELAIIRLNQLLSDHHSEKMLIDFTVIQQLQPLLYSCMSDERISDRLFILLGEAVNLVAYEVLINEKVTWTELWHCIALRSNTEFERSVFIFHCLTMPLEDDISVQYVVEQYLPEIRTRLNPPRELVGSSTWVWGFTAAICSIIHVLQMKSYDTSVKEISLMMIESVTKLVKRGTFDDGFVRSAFIDMESIVKRQLKWYTTSEYKFLKALLSRLYEIIGMEEETKSRLATINMLLDSKVARQAKEFPLVGEFDWLNQPEA